MKEQTVRHMVIFSLKHPDGSEAAKQFLEEGRRKLTQIPVVRNFEMFRQVSEKNDFDYGISMDFDSRADYEAYNAHPLHVQFVKEWWQTEVERFLEIDFQNSL